jgi:hypothetical protein
MQVVVPIVTVATVRENPKEWGVMDENPKEWGVMDVAVLRQVQECVARFSTVPKWIRAASTKIDDAGCKDLEPRWDKRLLSVDFPADTWLLESHIQRSDLPGESMLYRWRAPYGQSIFSCPHPNPSLARLVVKKEEEEPSDQVRWRYCQGRPYIELAARHAVGRRECPCRMINRQNECCLSMDISCELSCELDAFCTLWNSVIGPVSPSHDFAWMQCLPLTIPCVETSVRCPN